MALVELSKKPRQVLIVILIALSYIFGMATGIMLDAITEIDLHPSSIKHSNAKAQHNVDKDCVIESSSSEKKE